jgi:hypothetical protein
VRIGVNCYLLQPHIGGLKQYFLTLFRELLERDDEHEYVFFWYRHNAEELAGDGTRCSSRTSAKSWPISTGSTSTSARSARSIRALSGVRP